MPCPDKDHFHCRFCQLVVEQQRKKQGMDWVDQWGEIKCEYAPEERPRHFGTLRLAGHN